MPHVAVRGDCPEYFYEIKSFQVGDQSVLRDIPDFTDLFIPPGLCADGAIAFQANEKTYFLVPQEFQVFNGRIPTVGAKPTGSQTPLEYLADHLLEQIMFRKNRGG